MKRGFLNSKKDQEMGTLQDPRSFIHSGNGGWQKAVQASRLPPGVTACNSDGRWPTSNVEGLNIVSGEDCGLPANIQNKLHYDKRVRTEEPMNEEGEGNTADETVDDDTGMEVEPTISTEGLSNYSNNAFAGVPFMPTSMFGSPKLALNSLYGKRMVETPVTNAAFFHWDDNGPAHLRKHTCVFVCPETYERFPAGCHGEELSKFTVDEEDGIVWYTRKKEAEHGAAARRYDCYYYRQCLALNPLAVPKKHWGLDHPYQQGQGPFISFPAHIEEAIQKQVQTWKEAAAKRAEERREQQTALEQTAIEEEEAARDRETYREQRKMALAP
jgi:hypothetical protein